VSRRLCRRWFFHPNYTAKTGPGRCPFFVGGFFPLGVFMGVFPGPPLGYRWVSMKKILIVDDDPDVVDACRMFLEHSGFHVSAAYSRREGLEAIERDPPDIVVLDVMMERPDDGFAMARELRAVGFHRPIVMLTSISAATGTAFGPDAEMLPVDAFLDKPISPGDLVAEVCRLLDRTGAA
jgi:DNA-binding response OmpR family regulator